MKKTERTLTRDQWATLILGLALFFGLIIRLFPGLQARFPLNDGGMFLSMIRDLRANGFLLPQFTSYNFADIPYAYPPFGFYVAAALSLLGLPDLEILRWLPALVNFVSIPAFYLLANALLKDRPRAAVAAMIFAMVPSSYGWQIMGGGLTRSLGLLFIILALYAVYRMFERGTWTFTLLSILFGALAVLSHPEAGLATASACVLFWLAFGRTWRGTGQAALVALGVAALTAPWWGSVLAIHGTAPFLSVLHSGAYTPNPILGMLEELTSLGIWLIPFRILFVLGLGWALWRKKFFVPIWFLLPYLVEPRSAAAFAYLPACILAAWFFTDALPNFRGWLRKRKDQAAPDFDFTQSQRFGMGLFGLLLFWTLFSVFYDFALINTSLVPPAPQALMDWVRVNTPEGSRFVLVTGEPVMTDPLQEWFPALAERRSQTTLQGFEWTLNGEFFPRLGQLLKVQDCSSVACADEWSISTDLPYDYLLVKLNQETRPLWDSLESGGCEIVYEDTEYVVCAR